LGHELLLLGLEVHEVRSDHFWLEELVCLGREVLELGDLLSLPEYLLLYPFSFKPLKVSIMKLGVKSIICIAQYLRLSLLESLRFELVKIRARLSLSGELARNLARSLVELDDMLGCGIVDF
jgi:hypothetical protein